MCISYQNSLYNTIQYNTIQYNTIQYNTIQYNTIQYNTIQYNTIQYKSIDTLVLILRKIYFAQKFFCKRKLLGLYYFVCLFV
jgi:hypothetical protein